MGKFADAPLTAATLAVRLARARFWSRTDLHPLVVKDAVVAAKQVARRRVKHALPESMRQILPATSDSAVLDHLYAHAAVRRLAPDLATELFVLEPRPPLRTALLLLPCPAPESLCYIVLRTELRRENFLAAFAVLECVAPLSYAQVLGTAAACSGFGALSAWLWSPAPPIAAALALFWLVLGWPRRPRFPRVMWQHASSATWLQRLRREPQLRMANQIMQYYEDIRGVTVDNFHVHAARPQDPAVERALHAALSRLGMEMRPSRSTELYADYWSEQGYDYGRLEWREPDQDPADLEHAAAAPPPRHSTFR